MTEPTDMSCTMYTKLPHKKVGKYEDVENLKEIFVAKFGADRDRIGDIYTTHLELEIRKNTGFDEKGEKGGKVASFYFIIEITPKPRTSWPDVFDSVCEIVLFIRKIGGSVGLSCDYEDEIYVKIGEGN